MSNVSGFVIVMLVTIIWGYFAELRKGQLGWFVGRIVFMAFIYSIILLLL